MTNHKEIKEGSILRIVDDSLVFMFNEDYLVKVIEVSSRYVEVVCNNQDMACFLKLHPETKFELTDFDVNYHIGLETNSVTLFIPELDIKQPPAGYMGVDYGSDLSFTFNENYAKLNTPITFKPGIRSSIKIKREDSIMAFVEAVKSQKIHIEGGDFDGFANEPIISNHIKSNRDRSPKDWSIKLNKEYDGDASLVMPKDDLKKITSEYVTTIELDLYKLSIDISRDRLKEICDAEREGRCILLPTRNEEIIKQIEVALDIELYDWIKAYIFEKTEYTMNGRRTGRTLAHMLRLLLSKGDPIHRYLSRSPDSMMRQYDCELRRLYHTLSNPDLGLEIRTIYFNKEDVPKDEPILNNKHLNYEEDIYNNNTLWKKSRYNKLIRGEE